MPSNNAQSHRVPPATMAALPAVLLILLYAPSLHTAYRLDDLAWLSLRNTLGNGRSLLWALFSPQAQGSIRPLGDRVWFLLASSLFGLNPLPLHLLALAAQTANVLLLIAVGRRVLGSLPAAAIAAALWAVNDCLVEPMAWASALNEILYTFWFLLAFLALLRWFDCGKSRWFALHLAAVTLGFGTLELMVTFPAIAAVYVALFARNHWRSVLPSAVLAGIYLVAHLLAAPLPQSGPYRLTFGWTLMDSLARYWAQVLGPDHYASIHPAHASPAILGTALLSASVVLWLTFSLRRRRWTGIFGFLWFVLGLAPILPLREHFTPYYTFLPLIGLAWLAGDALIQVRLWPGRSLALACASLYVLCQIPSTLFVRDWYRERSRDTERREAQLAGAVQQVRRIQPEGPVFLAGVDNEQFWWGLCYGELTRRGLRDLHIMPDAAKQGVAIPPREWCLDSDFQLSTEETSLLLGTGRGSMYDIAAVPPRDVPWTGP